MKMRRYSVIEGLLMASIRQLRQENDYLRCVIKCMRERPKDDTARLVAMEAASHDL